MQTPVSQAARTRVSRRRLAAGFTLLEMMIVIMVIGLLAALGLPSISSLMRDRRTNQAAHEAALLYRRARTMAMGRGGAVMVRFDSSTSTMQLREAQTTTTTSPGRCASLPSTSCATNTWADGNPDNRVVSTLSFVAGGLFDGVTMSASSPSSGSPSQLDVCFTALGRPYFRTNLGAPFVPLTEVPSLLVSRSDGIGFARTVLVVPNGASRLAL